MYLKAAAVIPTYNEGSRVLEVARAAWESSCQEVIVVDDGSIEPTADILSKRSGLSVITHDHNMGKGQALDTGIRYALDNDYNALVTLDADLRGLQPYHVDHMLSIIKQGKLMVIGTLGLRPALVQRTILDKWGVLSGQRAMTPEIWALLSERDKQGFSVEAALNARMRKAGINDKIARTALEGLGHVGQIEKQGSLLAGVRGYMRVYPPALGTYVRIEMESGLEVVSNMFKAVVPS